MRRIGTFALIAVLVPATVRAGESPSEPRAGESPSEPPLDPVIYHFSRAEPDLFAAGILGVGAPARSFVMAGWGQPHWLFAAFGVQTAFTSDFAAQAAGLRFGAPIGELVLGARRTAAYSSNNPGNQPGVPARTRTSSSRHSLATARSFSSQSRSSRTPREGRYCRATSAGMCRAMIPVLSPIRMPCSFASRPSEPLSAYWIMAAEDGRREDLTWLERQLAYGFRIVGPVTREGFRLRLTAFDAREIEVRRGTAGDYRGELLIAKKRAKLERIHVRTDEAHVTPRVRHVDLHGSLPNG